MPEPLRFRGFPSYYDYYLAYRGSLIGPDDPRYDTVEVHPINADITPEELARFDDRDHWASLCMSYGEDIVGSLDEFLARRSR